MKQYLIFMLSFCLLVTSFGNIIAQKNGPVKMLRVNLIADDDNSTIPEVIIYAEGNTVAGLYRGISGQSGIAMLSIKSSGTFTVTVSHPKFVSAKQTIKISQYGDKESYTVNFRLKRKRVIEKESNTLNVYVKDRNNRPVTGATITVSPGRSAVTNSAGFAKTMHTQLPGEYIVVMVQANGFKDQQQRILTGVAQGTAITRPDDVATFVLEKGDNDRSVFHLVIEVLDDESYQPVNGASVKVELSDGASFSGSTNNKGEAKFTDLEYGFQGTTARVMVTHKDYKEKWSDIPAELMTAKDLDVRRFLGEFTLSGSGNAVSGNETYTENDWTSTTQVNGCKETGDKRVTCNWTNQYADADKSLSCAGTIEMTLSGNTINAAWKEIGAPQIRWKPGISQYSVSYIWHDGQIWNVPYKRK